MKTKKSKRVAKIKDSVTNHFVTDAILVILIGLLLLMSLALLSHNDFDSGWFIRRESSHIHNLIGYAGALFSDVALYLFGWSAILFIGILIALTIRSLVKRILSPSKVYPCSFSLLQNLGLLAILISSSALLQLYFGADNDLITRYRVGILGKIIAPLAEDRLGPIGARISFFSLFFGGLFLGLQISLVGLIWKIFFLLRNLGKVSLNILKYFPAKEKKKIKKKKPRKIKTNSPIQASELNLPPLSLLNSAQKNPLGKSLNFEETAELVERALKDFNIDAKVCRITPGPTVTLFEVKLAPGIKVNRLTVLNKDLARSLSVSRVRIVEIIPGKPFVGLEIPNPKRSLVGLKELLQDQSYQKTSAVLPLALGMDIANHSLTVALEEMPHLLIGGTTGSGKSVYLNSLILSLLLKVDYTRLKFIMIDPKMLELSAYDRIPHLLYPVVIDVNEASQLLNWAVYEMERRFQLMAKCRVRNQQSFNIKAERKEITNLEIDESDRVAMPHIVIVIDELADMMLCVGKKVEQAITRLAQKARAAGIHIIVATQRPSVDVITGLIKANIPTRISFQVSSRIDSRTILDQSGGEQLLGNGDLLYLPTGAHSPIRIQGAYVTDEEINRVVDFLKNLAEPEYISKIQIELQEKSGEISGKEEDADPLIQEAIDIIYSSGKTSISFLQRSLKIGFNRAARIIEELEKRDILTSPDKNGQRHIK